MQESPEGRLKGLTEHGDGRAGVCFTVRSVPQPSYVSFPSPSRPPVPNTGDGKEAPKSNSQKSKNRLVLCVGKVLLCVIMRV